MELCGTAGEPGAKLWGALGGTGATPSNESPTLSSPSGSKEYHCVPPATASQAALSLEIHSEGVTRRRVRAGLSSSAASNWHVS